MTDTSAGFWRRVAAALIDFLVCIPLGVGVFALVPLSEHALAWQQIAPSTIGEQVTWFLIRETRRMTSFGIWILYCSVFEATNMQATPGKKVLRLCVSTMDGGRLSVGRSFARNILKIASYAPCFLGFLWAAFSRDKRAWHDLWAGAHVTILQGRSA